MLENCSELKKPWVRPSKTINGIGVEAETPENRQIVVAINTDTFQALLSGLFKALLGWITSAFQLPIPIKF